MKQFPLNSISKIGGILIGIEEEFALTGTDKINYAYMEMCAKGTQRILQEGLSPSRGGDISIRDPQTNLVYISAGLADIPFPLSNFNEVEAPDIAIFTLSGRRLNSDKIATCELPMHLAILKARPEINCVLHVHAMWSTVFAMTGNKADSFPEDQDGFDRFHFSTDIQVAKYAPAGALDVGRNVVEVLGGRNAAILASHGAVAVGRNMEEAFANAKLLEQSTHMLTYEKILTGGKKNGL